MIYESDLNSTISNLANIFDDLWHFFVDESNNRPSDICILSNGQVWLCVNNQFFELPEYKRSSSEVWNITTSLTRLSGALINQFKPMANFSFYNICRVNIIMPPITGGGPQISIRIPNNRLIRLDNMLSAGFITSQQFFLLKEHIENRKNILVCGSTGSGKTTLLNALISECSENHRIVTIEDEAEIVTSHKHVVSLLSRNNDYLRNADVTLQDLVVQSLRMRPDRIIVGECRGRELLAVMLALNTGHEGSMATMHANSASDIPARIIALGILGGISREAVIELASSAWDYIYEVKVVNGLRKVTNIMQIVKTTSGNLEVVE